MATSEDFILINYKELAKKLAEDEFTREFHGRYSFHEIYEQVDEKGDFYMKMEFQSVLETMEEDWENILQEFDITNSVL